MKFTSKRLRGAFAGSLAIATVAALLPISGTVNALPPGTAAAGTVTISPTSGTFATPFSVTPPLGAVCPGDNTASYLYHSFITPFTNDPADIIYTPSGTPTGEPAFTNNLANASGLRSRNLAPGLGDGLIVAINNQTFSSAVFTGLLTPGAYWVGIACTQPDAATLVQTMKFYATAITVTATGFTVGVAASAPTLTAANAGNQTCAAVFTPGTSPGTSYTATATPGGLTATGAASPLTITGLTNNTAYSISVTATNTVGTSAASNALPCTPVSGPRTNVTAVTVTPGAPGSGNATVNWVAPAANTPAASPVSYDVVVAGPTPSTTSVPAPATNLALTGLATGNYTIAVTAVYADAPTSGTLPATAPVSFSASPSSVILQDIDVTRPVGSLVLTQVCSSNALIPAETAASLGFPTPLPAVPALNPSTVNSPTQTGLAPTLIEDGLRPGNNDPRFAEYPYPADANGVANPTYPTHCGIDLGKARFVTRGPGAGQFFAASGVIDEITIVDTRDDDAGWNVTGTMGTFSANGNTDSFSGSQLGWTPQATENTGAFTDSLGNTYDQQTTAGPVVAPNSPAASGLSSGKLLLSAAAGSGLGTAIGDARLKLLIPVTADAGLYQGTLTLSAA